MNIIIIGIIVVIVIGVIIIVETKKHNERLKKERLKNERLKKERLKNERLKKEGFKFLKKRAPLKIEKIIKPRYDKNDVLQPEFPYSVKNFVY